MRRRLHQPARHRDAQQRRGRGPGRVRACSAHRRAGQLDQRRDRPHARCRRNGCEAVIALLALREGLVPGGLNTTRHHRSRPEERLPLSANEVPQAASPRAVELVRLRRQRTAACCSPGEGRSHDACWRCDRWSRGKSRASACGPGLDGLAIASTRHARGSRRIHRTGDVYWSRPPQLPPAERRRVGKGVKARARGGGFEAARIGRAAGRDATLLPSVFTSSSGDGDNCDAICTRARGTTA